MERKVISAAEAVKAFKTRPQVQEAKLGKVPVRDADGKKVGERDGFIVSEATLSEKHVLGAARYDDKVVVVTIDGKRHEAAV